MTVVRAVNDLRAHLRDRRGAGAGSIGFVPTMGALHAGHAALMRMARAESATVVVSLFVNPRQFNDRADLAAYPRREAEDAALARAESADLLFAPAETEIYPRGDATSVRVGGPAEGFEGAARPGHFEGVATVCLKLFEIVRPAAAYFGQKDAQQVAVIRQLVRDMHLDLHIRVVPTVREADGLASSSRNARLSPDERVRAAAIPRALREGLRAFEKGADPAAAARRCLADLEVEYVDVTTFDGEPTLVMAARAGATRLIDNVPLRDPGLAGLHA
jgi:pantoate--beta-alanine ligase